MAAKEKEAPTVVEAPKFTSVKPHGWTDARAALLAVQEEGKKLSKEDAQKLIQAGIDAATAYLNPNGIALGKEHNSVPEVANCRAFLKECRDAMKKLK